MTVLGDSLRFDPDPAAVRRLPEEIARRFDVLPLASDGNELSIAIAILRVADDAQNAVIVAADERVQHVVAAFVGRADVASPQVEIEVKVLDVQPINDSSNIGLEFGGADLQGQPILGAATYAFSKGTVVLNARLNALVSQGRAQILATPRLVTLNNHEADLLIGQTYPIVYLTSAFGGQQVQFVDIGVKLRLTTTIGPDGSVTADLHPDTARSKGLRPPTCR